MQNFAQQLSRYSINLQYTNLPSEVVHEVKRRVIDSLGCALAAFHSEPGQIARKVAEGGSGGATLLGTRTRASVSSAAFANGTLVRYFDFNDTYLSKEPAHPSDNIASLLAASEENGRSGRDLITAIVLAYEIQCRLCDAASLRARGWDHVTYGAFSVVCGVGKLMGLSTS